MRKEKKVVITIQRLSYVVTAHNYLAIICLFMRFKFPLTVIHMKPIPWKEHVVSMHSLLWIEH